MGTNALSFMRATIQFGLLVCFVALAATFLTSFTDGRYLLVDVEEKGNPIPPDNRGYRNRNDYVPYKDYKKRVTKNGVPCVRWKHETKHNGVQWRDYCIFSKWDWNNSWCATAVNSKGEYTDYDWC